MPTLDGMALFDVQFEPSGLGELHWHANADELGYQLEGEGEVGIFSTDGTGVILPVEPGTVTFVPRGYFHYFRNLSAGPMHRAAIFSNAAPETYLWSATLPQVPQTWLAATFGLGPEDFPFLAARGTQFVVKVPGAIPAPPAAVPNPYSVQARRSNRPSTAAARCGRSGSRTSRPWTGSPCFPRRSRGMG